MITLDDFISNFAEQFEISNHKNITAATRFKELPDWDSLTALSIIAMVNMNYNVELKGADIRGASTIEDVYKIVVLKI